MLFERAEVSEDGWDSRPCLLSRGGIIEPSTHWPSTRISLRVSGMPKLLPAWRALPIACITSLGRQRGGGSAG